MNGVKPTGLKGGGDYNPGEKNETSKSTSAKIVMFDGMAPSTYEIMDNCKLAREMSLIGNYETSSVYYQGVITQITKLLSVIEDPSRQQIWRTIQSELSQEYELVRHIQTSLSFFTREDKEYQAKEKFEEPTRDRETYSQPFTVKKSKESHGNVRNREVLNSVHKNVNNNKPIISSKKGRKNDTKKAEVNDESSLETTNNTEEKEKFECHGP